jgi:serine/threonine protein kinase
VHDDKYRENHLVQQALSSLSREEQAVLIGRQLFAGLVHLHGLGLAHRDVKPQNIIAGWGEPGLVLKLIDFGTATEVTGLSMDRVGTAGFRPPEAIDVDLEGFDLFACDVFAAGVTLYTFLTGTFPFEADTNDEIDKKVMDMGLGLDTDPGWPARLAEALKLATAPAPGQRGSAQQCLQLLS